MYGPHNLTSIAGLVTKVIIMPGYIIDAVVICLDYNIADAVVICLANQCGRLDQGIKGIKVNHDCICYI